MALRKKENLKPSVLRNGLRSVMVDQTLKNSEIITAQIVVFYYSYTCSTDYYINI